MPYTPHDREQTAFKSGIQILASQDFDYTLEGGTIDAAALGARYVPVGFPFVQDVATRRYVPFVAATHTTDGVLNAGFRDPVLTNVDFNSDGVHNIIVGELIYRGRVYDKKLPTEVTAAFKAVTQHKIGYEDRGI